MEEKLGASTSMLSTLGSPAMMWQEEHKRFASEYPHVCAAAWFTAIESKAVEAIEVRAPASTCDLSLRMPLSRLCQPVQGSLGENHAQSYVHYDVSVSTTEHHVALINIKVDHKRLTIFVGTNLATTSFRGRARANDSDAADASYDSFSHVGQLTVRIAGSACAIGAWLRLLAA